MSKTCKQCKHYGAETTQEGVTVGFCFRYPPAVKADGGSQMPPVRADLPKCGEFKRAWFK